MKKEVEIVADPIRTPTYARHLLQVELVAVEAVAGVAFPHTDAAAVLAAVQNAAFLSAETLEAVIAP